MENKSIFDHAPLRGLIKTVPASSFVAMLLLIGCMVTMYQIVILYGSDENTRNIALGYLGNLLTTVAVFYFSSKFNKSKEDS